jgi:hypothetical protein
MLGLVGRQYISMRKVVNLSKNKKLMSNKQIKLLPLVATQNKLRQEENKEERRKEEKGEGR